ncbi:MAG: NfeD family protein [Myxococcota bacterium]|jgi:membrane protein implicated in regulation of membrane protease activity|nr:NfeD family protein [Myxococcota bacterium]
MNQTASRNDSRKTLQKYIVMQIPGATMVGFLLVALYYLGTLSGGLAALMMVGWCAKDAVMFRFVRSAYEPGPPHGTEALIGRSAIVIEACAPEGRVRIGAEHWSARSQVEGETLPVGEHVKVVAADGFTLRVTRAGT